MKKRLLFLTWDYPFKAGTEAGFIEPELSPLSERFDVEIAAVLSARLPASAPALCPIPYAPAGRGNAVFAFFGVLTDSYFYADLAALNACKRHSLSAAVRIYYQYLHAHRIFAALYERFRSSPPDLGYSFWGMEGAYALTLLKRRFPQMKCVTRFHGCDLYLDRSPSAFQPFRKAFRDRMDRLYFISRQGLDYYRTNFLHREAQLRLAFLGCPESPVSASPDFTKLVIVSCSRTAAVKRLGLFLESLALTKIPVCWHHFGGGVELEALKRQAETVMDANPLVTCVLHGETDNAALRPAYREVGARLLLNLSSSEGLPVSMMEALSMGLPAMGTDVGGVRELITPDTGMLLNADPAPEEVMEALTRFAALPEHDWRGLSDQARALYASAFQSDRNAVSFSAELERITAD